MVFRGRTTAGSPGRRLRRAFSMAVAASGAQQAVPVWAGVTTTSPPSTANPASTAGLPTSGNRAARASAAPSASTPRRRPWSDGIPRSQVRTVAAGTVAVLPSIDHRQLADGQRLRLRRQPLGVGQGVLGRHRPAGDGDQQRELLAPPATAARPGRWWGRCPAPACRRRPRCAPSLSGDVGLDRRLPVGVALGHQLRTASSSTSRITGAFRDTTKPVAQFHMRTRRKPSWPTLRAASAVASASTEMPSSGAAARKPPSGALTSTSAAR